MPQQYNLPRSNQPLTVQPPPQGVVTPPNPVPMPQPPMDPAIQKAFLKTIARGEAKSYNALAGNGTFSDFSRHPTPGPSQPAGMYQFLGSTWNEQAKKYGYKDFSPETQDTAAVNYAREVYKAKTGRNLDEALASGDPAAINMAGQALNKTWTSLPGGPEQNSPWRGRNFADVYNENLKSGNATAANAPLDPTPNVGAGASAYAKPEDTVSTSTEQADKTDKKDDKKKDKYKDAAGDAIGDIGKLFSEGPVAKNAARASGPTNIAPPTQPMPTAPISMIDPKRAEMQRQQLAIAMQRLNSGKLV